MRESTLSSAHWDLRCGSATTINAIPVHARLLFQEHAAGLRVVTPKLALHGRTVCQVLNVLFCKHYPSHIAVDARVPYLMGHLSVSP